MGQFKGRRELGSSSEGGLRCQERKMVESEMKVRVIDAESHVMEPRELWTEYVEPDYRVLARSSLLAYGDEVTGEVILNGLPVPGLSSGRLPRYAIWRPGMSAEEIGMLDPREEYPMNP